MDFATRRVACRASWLVVLMLASFAAVVGACTTTASAQAVADPDYWKGTAERQSTVNRFVYTHAPQTIPSSYDPVREAEEILRQRARALPPSSPQARAVWSQTQRLTVASRLAPALRSLGTIGLGVGVFELGWKIGTGANAKFLKIGLPEATDDISSFRWIQLRWTTAHSRSEPGVSWPAEDGWVPWMRQMCCAGIQTDRWFAEPCPFNGFTPPHPFVVLAETSSSQTCETPGGVIPRTYEYGWAPEDALTPTAPTEPHTDQPYNRHSSTVTPPPQSTVEQTIDAELDKPENELLRDWFNYELGSPGAEDPVGEGVNVPQPAVAPGTPGEDFVDALDELGLTNIKFKVLSNPEFDPAFDEGAVVRVSPPPGTSVEPGDEIEVTVNRTAQRQNNGECDRSLRRDPGPPLSGDEFSLKDTFTGNDPDQGFAPTDVPFRWGTTGWGYRHVEIGHGWDNAQDRADTQLALLDPAPEPDQPGSHRFYYFYMGPNRTPCTRRVIARFNALSGEPGKRGIITSFAHPGWYRRNDFN